MSSFRISKVMRVYVAPAMMAATIVSAFSVVTPNQALAAIPTVCKKNVNTGTGRFTSKDRAAKAARAKWRYVVTKKHGLRWAVWSLAKVSSKKCSKKWGIWKCRYQAKACKPYVPTPGQEPNVCKKGVNTGTGRFVSKGGAAKAARAKWRYVVAKKHGSSWAVWSLAKVSSKKCSKKWGVWKCRYQAKACKTGSL
jgi:hypothetical protein